MLLAGAVLLAAIKLWLVSADEIAARPAEAWYVASAARFYWGGSFADDAFLRLPGYPLWLALVDRSGVPLRVAIELVLTVAAFTLAWSAIRIGYPVWAGLLLIAVVVFHPVSFDINNYAHPDTFYAPLLLLAIAFLALQYVRRDKRGGLPWGLAAGVAIGWLWIMRPEAFLLLTLLLGFAILILVAARRRTIAWRDAVRHALFVALLPAGATAGVVLLVKAANHAAFGVFATSETTAPGFRAANRALLSAGAAERVPYVPLTRAARSRAYDASPLFARLRPWLEAAADRDAYGSSGGVERDLEGEALPLALRNAVRGAGATSASEAEQYYRQLARELRAACRRRTLECRRTPHAFLPVGGAGLSSVPGSALAAFTALFQPWIPARERDHPVHGKEIAGMFDRVANRRSERTSWPSARVSGWAFVSGDPVVSLAVRDRTGNVLAENVSFAPRPDLPANLPQYSAIPLNAGFAIEFPVLPPGEITAVFTTRSGRTFGMPVVGLLRRGRMSTLADGGASLHFNVDTHARTPSATTFGAGAAVGVQNALWRYHLFFLIALSLAALVGLATQLVDRRIPPDMAVPAAILPALLALAVLSRMGMVSIVDALAWPVHGYRYMYAGMLGYAALGVLVIARAICMAMAARAAGPALGDRTRLFLLARPSDKQVMR
jgi:hypothetical protein